MAAKFTEEKDYHYITIFTGLQERQMERKKVAQEINP